MRVATALAVFCYPSDLRSYTGKEVDPMAQQGKVKWFNSTKGFGFIIADDGTEVFVHHTAIQSSGFRTLEEGQRVEFDVTSGPKGLKAENVQPL
jgi:CspA family cold shock protein